MVKASQIITLVGLHVEQVILRIKTYRLGRNELPLTLHGSINEIWTVICLLTNLATPLINTSDKTETYRNLPFFLCVTVTCIFGTFEHNAM